MLLLKIIIFTKEDIISAALLQELHCNTTLTFVEYRHKLDKFVPLQFERLMCCNTTLKILRIEGGIFPCPSLYLLL